MAKIKNAESAKNFENFKSSEKFAKAKNSKNLHLTWKLYKYNAYKMYRIWIWFYVAVVVSAILARVTSELTGDFVLMFIKGFCNGLFYSMLSAMVANMVFALFAQYRRDFYGQGAYLTQVLPMKTGSIFMAWWWLALTATMTTLLFAVVGCVIAFAGTEFGAEIVGMVGQMAEMLQVPSVVLVVGLILVLALEVLTALAVGLLGINLGHRANNQQILKSVAWGIIIYMATQAVVLTVVYLCGYFNEQIMAVFHDEVMTNFDELQVVLYFATILYMVMFAVMSGVSHKLVKRGVNVE